MNDRLRVIIRQAEEEAWARMSSYKTVLEAVTKSKAAIFSQTLAEILIKECVEICEKNGDTVSAAEINAMLIFEDTKKSVDK